MFGQFENISCRRPLAGKDCEDLNLQSAVKAFSPFAVSRVLFLNFLCACFDVAVLNSIHSRIRLIHERLQYPLVLNCFRRQNNFDELLRRNAMELQVPRQALHNAAEFHFGVGFRRHFLFDFVLGPGQHGLKLPNFGNLQIPAHYHLHHALAEVQEVGHVEQCVRLGLDECQYHVDQLGRGRVAPVVVLERYQHSAHHVDAQELLRVVEARLQQLGQVVMLGSANKTCGKVNIDQRDALRQNVGVFTWDRDACQWTAAGVQIVQQNAERVRIELDDAEFGLRQLCSVHLLRIGADRQPRNGQLAALLVLPVLVLVCTGATRGKETERKRKENHTVSI